MALEVLEEYIGKVDFFEYCKGFNDALQALSYIRKEAVDLIFLDIQMPDLSGIQFLQMLEERKLTILTTAYSDYALQSYDFEVLDYLLKPIQFDRFFKAAQKAWRAWSTANNTFPALQITAPQIISIKSGYDTHMLRAEGIKYIEGNGNYLNFYTEKGKILSLMKMDEALHLLPDYFIRVHKSYIVNINEITTFSTTSVIINGRLLPISKTFKKNLKRATKDK